MNSFTLTAVGNLARNPELVAKNDTSYTRFCIVGNDYAGKDEEGGAREVTTSLWFVAFGAMGEALARNARKGDQLIVEAHVRANNWTDKQGEKQYDHSFILDRQEYVNLRERWATLTNEALRDAHVAARVDHRSLAAQGIEREPQPAIPLRHLKMEQRGLHSTVADRLRREYRERVRNRLERAAVPARDAPAAAGELSTAATTAASGTSQVRDPDEIRRQAVKQWLLFRAQEAEKSGGQFRDQERGSEHSTRERDAAEPESERQAQDDRAL